MIDFGKIEAKWQKRWQEQKLGEANRDHAKKKFFMIFAYPGISGYLHIGHMRGFSYTDAITRYKRMTGHNVLFPVGTHASGNQAIAFANKVKKKDKAWLKYMKDNGCDAKKLKLLTTPENVVAYFNDVYINDYWKKFGFLIDERRFLCTIYPDYNKFIQWQFRKLQEKSLLVQKPYFATFCPKCGPVAVDPSETDISKGGNAVKQEYTILKFKFGNKFIIAATLRPETVYGQTNLWVNPKVKYAEVKVGKESWIMSEQAFEKLKYQKEDMELVGYIKGKDMIGKYCIAPRIKREIIILPAEFCAPEVGSGIVTCVPSDAPYDYVALRELQSDEKLCRKYGLDYEKVRAIKLIPIIKSKGYGDFPAKEIVEKLGIKSQKDVEKLEEATKEIYKAGFHTGVMNDHCGEFSGLKVEVAKERMAEKMIEENDADVMHDLSEEVVCRCGEEVIIKRIDNQWFIKYSDSELTEKSKEHAKTMSILPQEYYENMPGVLDWFQDRACARLGNWLGTKLPFDDQWTIEPISDSTLYPAYYIVSLYVNSGKLKPEQLTEEFFDYVYLGKGDAKKIKVDTALLDEIRKDFEYWYPLDINLGGKEHKTVHFPVFLMNHVAILEEKHWPKGIFVNWWVTGKGSKISKSKGGAEPIPGAIGRYSVDGMRLYYAHIGSPHADVVWDQDVVDNYRNAIEKIYSLAEELLQKEQKSSMIDHWLISQFNEKIKKITNAMDKFDMRVAATEIYFSITEDLRWYVRRGGSNRHFIRDYISKWARLLAPITPHTAEEINSMLGNKDLVSASKWPDHFEGKIDFKSDSVESMIHGLLGDVRSIMQLANVASPKKVSIIVSERWKYGLFESLKKEMDITRDIGRLMKVLMANEAYRGKPNLDKLILSIVKNPARMPHIVLDQDTEFDALKDAKEFLKKEFSCEVLVEKAEESREEKARQASPGKPAILVQ